MAKILLVDDMSGVRRSVQAVLKAEGHSIVEAPDGQVAISRLKTEAFDLVITDVLMPEVDGLEVLMAARALPRPVPTLLISGGAPGVSIDSALRFGREMRAVTLAKPFDRKELADAVRQALAAA